MKKLKQIGAALNAYTFSFDDSDLDEIRLSFKLHIEKLLQEPERRNALNGGKVYFEPLGDNESEYFLSSYGANPLLWLSCNTDHTYRIYRNFFDKTGIAEDVKKLVDYENDIRVYCGFLVIGNKSSSPLWHVDYDPGANGYTLITPLFDIEKEHGNLLYVNARQQPEKYFYKKNEAIIFGDRFLHTTEPYPESDKLRVLLSLTFGTDKIMYWPILRRTIATQSKYLILPCGHRFKTCECMKPAAPKPVEPTATIGRNSPCHCGSGLRFKSCHGKLI
jgi:hypothetical protein